MAKVYSWEVSKTPKQYAYIVHPNDYSKAYIGSELKGTNLQKIISWASTCTDTEYEEQFEKMKNLCVSKNYDVEFETVTAYMDVRSSCDNLRGPAGRGIDHIALLSDDAVTNISTYIIYYDDGTTDTFDVRNGKNGKDGIDGKPGAKGDSGVSSKFIMVYTSGRDTDGNLFTPERPTGGSYDFVLNEATYPTGWGPNDSEKTPPIWMSSRTFASTEASTDKQWSIPVQITGENGAPGVDGVSTEFIYLLDTVKPNIDSLPSLNENGYVPTGAGWTGSPTGVDEDNPVEWCCIRKMDKSANKWGNWEGPTIWSKYGVNGQDGDGVQYIYLRNKGSLPKNPTPLGYNDSTSDVYSAYQDKNTEWIPPTGTYINYKGQNVTTEALEEVTGDSIPAGIWTDNPTDVNQTFQYQWVSSRKYRKGSDGKMLWQTFSDPALWGKFGEDGKNATSIRKIYALSDSTSNPPTLPADSVITGDWGTGFPKDYESGVNVVWGSEAEIWAHNFEFVKSYKLASSKDKDGNVIEPDDLNSKNWVEVLYLPDEENISYKYIKFNDEYYSWQGGWCEPYLVTGLKGDNGQPIDYTTYVFAYGYTDFIPEPPSGTSPNNPGYSIDGNGNTIIWEDFPNTTGGRVDGAKDENGKEKRWYQCTGHVDGRTNAIKEWSGVTPCNGRDGEALPGKYTEVRFGITEDDVKPDVIEYNEGNIIREPILLNKQGKQWGWYATDTELPDVPKGGTMWQIWALIDGATNEVLLNNGKGWNGPRRVSGEKGEQGIQGPAGLRGVTGIPGATSNQMYCLGTFGKNENSESYWETGGIDGGDGYFGGIEWQDGVIPSEMTGWFTSKYIPYPDIIDVTTISELQHVAAQTINEGRVVRLITATRDVITNSTTGKNSAFVTVTHTYYLVESSGTYKQLTHALPEDEEFNVYVWCIQGNDVWEAGLASKYVQIEKPDDVDENNSTEVSSIPKDKNELYKYLIYKEKYYEWRQIEGDKVEHRLVKVEWGSPFKLQGTNGLRGLAGNRGQVVYPMGVYNHEEVYLTTDKKAPYVYDPNDGLFYVYNIVDKPWVGQLPENYQEIKIDMDGDGIDEYYKYSIDGTGNEGTWMGDQDGDTPANNFANAENAFKTPAWVRFESFQALYTSIGIIANGMIGSAVYNNEFMFSQQGIDSNDNKTNYAIVSAQGTDYGFLSGYDYDEKGEFSNGISTGRHWKYRGSDKYISDVDVDPYEVKTETNKAYFPKVDMGKPIHTFRPNVCINFSTGQMWLSTGQIKFGQLSRNILTKEETNKNVKDATDALNKTLTNNLNTLKEQVDKRADTYYGKDDPSVNWQTSDSNSVGTYAPNRVGDFWYNTNVNKSYVFATSSIEGKTLISENENLKDSYYWVESDVPQEVYNRINSRSKIFVDEPVAPYYVGDLWFVHKDYDSKNEFYDGPDKTIKGMKKETCLVCMNASTSNFSTKHWGKRDHYADEADVINAQRELDEMNTQLTNWASDGLLSPLERQSLKNEYDSIIAEYDSIVKQAKNCGLENVTDYTNYTSAYANAKKALDYYIDSNNVETGSDCVKILTEGDYSYGYIKTYYEKRQLLLQKISDTLNLNNKTTQSDLNTTKNKLNNWADDGYISPLEMRSLENELNAINAEYEDLLKQAENVGISKDSEVYKNYKSAKTNAVNALTYHTNTENVEKDGDSIKILTEGDNSYSHIKTYYEKKQLLLVAISDALKKDISSLSKGVALFEDDYNILKNTVVDSDGNLKIAAGVITTTNFSDKFDECFNSKDTVSSGDSKIKSFAGLFAKAVEEDTNIVKSAQISAFVTEDDVNGMISNIKLSADKIALEGYTTINGGFSVDESGNVTMTNADVSGKITATSGTIGGFEIANGRIGASATSGESSFGNLALYNDFLRVGGSNGYVMFGNDVIPASAGGAFTATGRIVNNNVGSYDYWFPTSNYGIFIDVSGSTKNYGIKSNAPLIAPAFISTGMQDLIFKKNATTYTIDFSQGNIITMYNENDGDVNVTLPTESDVAYDFGYGSSLPDGFCTVIVFTGRRYLNNDMKGRIILKNIYNGDESLHDFAFRGGDTIVLMCCKSNKFSNTASERFRYRLINYSNDN